MVEKILAAIGLTVCIALLLWTLIGARRRDALRQFAQRTLHWRSHRRQAEREAAQAIERARRSVTREGNVYRPTSFKSRPPRDDQRRH